MCALPCTTRSISTRHHLYMYTYTHVDLHVYANACKVYSVHEYIIHAQNKVPSHTTEQRTKILMYVANGICLENLA